MELKDILNQMPEGYKKACWETKAMNRRRGIQDEDTLLTLCLYYSYENSLIDTQNYASTAFSVDISDVGFMKRFKNCNEWIKWNNEHIALEKTTIYEVPDKLKSKNVIAVDASDITSKSAVKQTWRLHYAVNLFSMSTDQFKITPESTGESLKNFELNQNDLVLADRAYATIVGIECCHKAKADFIMRIRNKAFKLYDKDGNEVVLSELLKNIGDACCDINLYYMNTDKKLKPIRFCAVQKTEEEKAFEQKKLKQKESKKQIKISEETKFSHNYFFVVTSLDETFSAEQILALYRLRWQVEIVFKRFKSILNLGSMPTKTAASSEVWLNCKMLIALLIEKLISSVDFSPYEFQKEFVEGDEDLIPFDFKLLFERAII